MHNKKAWQKMDLALLKEVGPQLQLLPLSAREPQVFAFLRSAAQLFEIRLTGSDREEWVNAKAQRQAEEFADQMGYMLAKDLPKHIKPMLSYEVDFPVFADWWTRAVPTLLVIDPDEETCVKLSRWVNTASDYGIWARDYS